MDKPVICPECGSADGLRRVSAAELARAVAEGQDTALQGLLASDPPGPFLYMACACCGRFAEDAGAPARYRPLDEDEAWMWANEWYNGPAGLGWTDSDFRRWEALSQGGPEPRPAPDDEDDLPF
jgi:hypothetical protein